MTAAATIKCSCCYTPRPANEVYEPVRGLGEYRCTDLAGCRYRAAYVGDPVGPPVDSRPAAVSGAECSICRTIDPPGGAYERTRGMYVCLDRTGCTERSVEFQFLTAHREDFPEVASTQMTAGMHAARAAGAQIPPEPTELTPDKMAALAAQDALGRKRGGTSRDTSAT